MFRKTLYLVAALALVLATIPVSATPSLPQGTGPRSAPSAPAVERSAPRSGSQQIGPVKPDKPSHRISQQNQGPAPEAPAPAAEAKAPAAPPTLVTLKSGSDARRFGGYLAWLRFNGQIEDFSRVEGSDAFLVYGEKGLGSVTAQSEVANLAPATAEKIAAAQADSLRQAQAELKLPARPSGIQAYTPTTPTVSIWIYETQIYIGNAITGTVYVTVTKGVGGAQYFASYSFPFPGSTYLYPNIPYPYIEPGDTVEVNEAGGSGLITQVVPDLHLNIDRVADTVSGKAPVAIGSTTPITPPTLYVNAYSLLNRDNGNYQSSAKYLTTDGIGNFTTAFTYTLPTTGIYDIQGGRSYFYLTYLDPYGNAFYQPGQWAPGFEVQLNTDYADGYTKPRTPYTVTLKNSAGVVKGQFTGIANTSGGFGGSFRDAYGNRVASAPGDTVSLSGAYTIDVPVVNLTATADPVADTVTGLAPVVNSTSPITLPNLWVGINSGGYITNPTGTYLVYSNTVGNFDPGDQGGIWYWNPNADWVYMYFSAPVLAARGSYYNNYVADNFVSGYASMPNVVVSIALKRAGATVGTATALSSGNGWFTAYLVDIYGNAVNIQPNDTLEASTGASVFASLIVPTFDVASDAVNDRVTGTTDATIITTTRGLPQTLAVWPQVSYDWDYGKHVTATIYAANPFYQYADPAYGSTILDWDPGSTGHYRYINSAGYQVYGKFTAPYNPTLSLRWDRYQYNNCSWCYPQYALKDSYVSGKTKEPNAYVSIVLKRSGTPVGWATANSDYNGNYVAQLRDALNAPAPILDGDTVEATANGVTTSALAPTTMTANANYDTDILTGTLSTIIVSGTVGLPGPTGWLQADYYIYGSYWSAVNVTTTAAGAYSVTLPNLTNNYPQGYLNYADANGNHVYKAWTATGMPGAAPKIMLRGDTWWNSGYVADNYVFVNASASGTLTVTRGTTQLATWSFWSGGNSTNLYQADGSPLYLQPGDNVQATANDATTTIVVPTVSVSSDPVLDRLTGTTDADVITMTYGATRTLALWPTSTSDGYYGKYVQPAGGAFTAANPFYWYANPLNGPSTFDWNSGQQGHYRYVDANNNAVYGRFIAPYTPKLWIQENGNYLGGYVATPGVPVTVTLKNSTGTVKATRYTTSDRFNAYFEVNLYDAVGNPVYILANDVVEVATPSVTLTVPVTPLSAQVNATTNVVSGSGPANASLSIEVHGSCGANQPAITDGSGAFSIDFTGVCDIRPGDYARIRYINANGHEIYLNRVPAPQLRVNKGNNYVEGYVARFNTSVVGTLKDSGGAIRATATMTSSWSGFYSFNFVTSTGVPTIIATGDVVEVVSSGAAMSLTVPTLTASVNPSADTVTGQAPGAGALVQVELRNANDSFVNQKAVTADGGGNYAAGNPWGTSSYDVMAGWRTVVYYTNADGNQVYLGATAPVVYVRGDYNGYTGKNRVTGYVTPFAVANVALKRGGSTVASASYSTGSSGWFDVYLYDVTGAAATILDGDQVVVTGSTMTVNVPTINATAYAVTNTLQGTISPAGSSLKVVDVWNTGCIKSVTSDGTTGAFSATNPFYDSGGNSCNVTFYPGDAIDAHYVDASGNWVYQRFIVVGDATTGAAMIYARWDGGSVRPNYVSGYATAPNAVVALALKRGGTTVGFATTNSDSGRWFNAALLDTSGKAVSILTGDVIEMTSGGTTTSFTVLELTTAFNNTSGVLYGKGPANSPLYCSNCSSSITTGPDGTYAVSAGSSGYVRYTDASGNRVYTSWRSPYVWVRENGSEVYGSFGAFYTPVIVTLKSGGMTKATATTTSDGSAYFDVYLRDAAGNPAIIAGGDTVEVSAGGQMWSIPVAPLSLNVNLTADRLTGTGPANTLLDVYAGNSWRNPTADATGAYTADFSGYYDIKPGDWVETDYWNNAGRYGIWLGYNAPLVRVNATADIVDGYTTPNKAVSLALKRGGSTLATANTASNANGFFSAFFTNASGAVVDILAGDVVDVTASPTNSVTIPTLTANLNAATNVVAGTGPANSAVRVWAFHWNGSGFNSYDKSVSADGSGNYTADFTSDVDLLDYDYAYVRYTDANGNQSAVNTTPATSPLKTQAEQSVTGSGVALKTSVLGVGNNGDLSTPLLYKHLGGKATFTSRNGGLYITAPNGTVYDVDDTFFTINNAPAGTWKVQVRIWWWYSNNGEGEQYAIAAGNAAYTSYLPLIRR